MSAESQVRVKGKFSSKKRVKRLQQCAEMGKKNKKKTIVDDHEHREENTFPVEGHRIVDLKYMARNMFCSSCRSPLLLQNIQREAKKGLASILHIFCDNCIFLNTVTTGDRRISPTTGYPLFDINTKAAIGKCIYFIASAICTTDLCSRSIYIYNGI